METTKEPTIEQEPETEPQWSHGREAVETTASFGRRPTDGMPQWSHGREAVETFDGIPTLEDHVSAAMEPRP